MGSDVIPEDMRQLRACMICSLVKNQKQFVANGCENCDEFIDVRTKIASCTTTSFEGMMAMMIPSESWVAKWQHISKFTPGMYAIAVHGNLPEDIVQDLESAGYRYHPRYPT